MGKKITLEALLSGEDGESLVTGLSFEEGLQILEELVTKVESGSLALDKAIVSYEKGVKLIERLRALLSGAEEKLKVLQKPGNSAQGAPAK